MKNKRIFYYFWESAKKHRFWFFFMFLCYGIASISSNTLSPLLFKKIIDLIEAKNYLDVSRDEIMYIVLLIGLNTLAFNIFYRIGDLSLNKFEARSMRDLSRDTFNRLLKHSYSFYANSFAGSLVAKAKRFTTSFEGIVDKISLEVYFIILKLTGIFVVLFIQAPKVAYVFLAWFILYVGITFIFVKKKRKYDLKIAEADSEVTASLADVITNIINLKIFASSKSESVRHQEVLQKEYIAIIRSWMFTNWQWLFQGLMIGVLQISTIFIMVDMWLRGEASTGLVVLVQTYMIIIFDPLWAISRTLIKFIKDLSNAEGMIDILDKPIDILDPENPEVSRIKNGDIKFENICFAYGQNNKVFENFNLHIKPGEKIGLVGRSGAGKTTITKILLRFIDVQSGTVLIDGQNIKNLLQDDLRSNISYVPQDPILFHRTIEENISYSKENSTKEEIVEAAKKAHAHEFISNFHKGYDTLVGERGIKLSGGERQRVAIARAMLKDAPIIVLDEATSSLDSESEFYIQDAFNKLMENKTTIVIAHRLSTIKKMDRIIVLDQGGIVEEGTHEELISKDGQYAKLWNHQTGGFLEGVDED
ncbi:MAG: ABC transporter ATP-binding protein [Candidatus Pacebacteria bacterium]|nr:ABC transporter ATP-binding protein [Candidatus Paceibacterota bacterium]MBP9851522.1 ABC transporter ATP-binding protein [Candidatus Paceibacterota bacterium]